MKRPARTPASGDVPSAEGQTNPPAARGNAGPAAQEAIGPRTAVEPRPPAAGAAIGTDDATSPIYRGSPVTPTRPVASPLSAVPGGPVAGGPGDPVGGSGDPGSGSGGEPAARGPGRRRGLRSRITLIFAATLSVAVLATTVSGWVALTVYDRKIARASIALPHVEVSRPPAVPAGTENWLLVGSDVRTGTDAAKVGGARSDTMMIAHLSSDGTTRIVSIPRDLYLPIPAYTDGDGGAHRARRDRVNSAFNSGGPALLVATLEQLTGVRIDHYAEIDFGGFQQMTTAIGGVDVCLTASPYVETVTLDNGRRVHATNLNDPSSGFVGQPGTNHLIGAQALAFVRQRHGFIDGDLSRIHRQQAFLAAVFRKVSSGDVLLRPAKLAAFLGAVTRSTVLDNGTDIADLRRLADRLRGMDSGAVTFATIPVTGEVAHPAFYFLYDPDAVRAFFARTMGEDGSTADADSAGASPGAGLDPGDSPGVIPQPGVTPSATVPAAGTDGTALSATPTPTATSTASSVSVSAGASRDAGRASLVGSGLVVAGPSLPGAAVTPRSATPSTAPSAGAAEPAAVTATTSPTAVPTTTAVASCIQ
ncbi:LCP family protein [Frankia sp. AiPs1]|uniref:LCP family protein n=1 Tax=Frankia sp. AiPs1 TaxID=573493 RepID=UPI00204495B0|nr:LCP family protein [Frankia sp. AiPs1]MCM3924194.1 LCP family protein [Frankia sp. AiPs1]